MSFEQNQVVSDSMEVVSNILYNNRQPADNQLRTDSEDDEVAVLASRLNYSPGSPMPSPPKSTIVSPEPVPIQNQVDSDSDDNNDDEDENEERYEILFLQDNIDTCQRAKRCLQRTNDIINRYKSTRRRLQRIRKTLLAAREETRTLSDKFQNNRNDLLKLELSRYSEYVSRVLRVPANRALDFHFASNGSRSQSQPVQHTSIQCGLCYEAASENLLALSPCGHTLCKDCYDRYFTRGSIDCPFCRVRVTAYLKLFF